MWLPSPTAEQSSTNPEPSQPASSEERFRLLYLDGLRGLTALLIVLCHVFWELCPQGFTSIPSKLSPVLTPILTPLAFSNKVGIFLILSGFLLTLPLVRGKYSDNGNNNRNYDRSTLVLRGGLLDFLKRRAQRILPPYFASLILCLLLIVLIPYLQQVHGTRWDIVLPAFRLGPLLSHLFLIHNLHPHWIATINPPCWSLAIEWQMYFLFALVLLPLWRRFGLWAPLLAGLVLGYLPHFLLPSTWNYDWTTPWYINLFTLGMGAAALAFARPLEQVNQTRTIALRGMFVIGGILAFLLYRGPVFWSEWRFWADLVLGSFVAMFLVYATCAARSHQTPWSVRLLQNRPLLALGRISYSLYLVHFPILTLTHLALLRALRYATIPAESNRAFLIQLAALYLIGVPIALVAATCFSKLFEGKAVQKDNAERPSEVREQLC